MPKTKTRTRSKAKSKNQSRTRAMAVRKTKAIIPKAAARLAAPAKARIQRTAKSLRIQLNNGTAITLEMDGAAVLGIRQVEYNGLPLRNPGHLWRPLISTSVGIYYVRFELAGIVAASDGSVVVKTRAIGASTGIYEEQDVFLSDLIVMDNVNEEAVDEFEWEFRPSRKELAGQAFAGFAYRYRFATKSPRRAVYRLFDHATWEIGGHVVGNTLLLQGQCNAPVTELTKKGYFYTMGGQNGPPKRITYQRPSRMGLLQAFDCLVHRQGTLLGLFDPVEEIFAVVQKAPGEDWLHVVDEHRRPRGQKMETHPKHILFAPAPADWSRAAQRNLWWNVYQHVHQGARARVGIKPTGILPSVWIPQVSGDNVTLDGQVVPRTQYLRHLGDHFVQRWADMGARLITIHSIWVSDYTVDRFTCKQDTNLHGGLVVGSICNVRVHEVDPLWGGVEGLAHLTAKAHAQGMKVHVWWATHLTRRAPIFTEHPEFMTVARDGQPNGAAFGRQSLITVNLNAPGCVEWMADKLISLRKATGIDGVFHDSYGNMTFLPTDFGDAQRRGQQAAYARLVARLQQAGIEGFYVEGLGPYGAGHFGMGEKTALEHKWWVGQEDMVYGLDMGIGNRVWPGKDDICRRFAFRCLAHGGHYDFTDYQGGVEYWTGWLRDLNRLHARFARLSGQRTILPDGRAVLWETDANSGTGVGTRLLFALESGPLPLPAGARAVRITPDGEANAAVQDGRLLAESESVYRLV